MKVFVNLVGVVFILGAVYQVITHPVQSNTLIQTVPAFASSEFTALTGH